MKIIQNRILILFGLLVFSIVFSSCISSRQKKSAAQLEQAVGSLQHEDSLLQDLAEKSQEKLYGRRIDSLISSRINEKLTSFSARLDSLRNVAEVYDSMIQDKKAYRKSYRKILISGVPVFRDKVTDSVSRHHRYQVYAMIDDLLSRARQNLFDYAAFFGPGEYRIPPGNQEQVNTQFSPLIDSMAAFANKYPDLDKEVVLSFYGYADGLSIEPQSQLGKVLTHTGKLGANPSRQGLNQQLSEQRAKAMQQAFRFFYVNKLNQFVNPQNIVFVDVVQGLGEEYPNPNIRDYQQVDERRRIVLFYWGILPR